MSTATFESIIPFARTQLPGCSVMMVEQELKRAAEVFFRESLLMRDCVDIWLHPDKAEYPLELGNGLEIAEVMAVTYNGNVITPAIESDLDVKETAWRSKTGDSVSNYLLTAPDTIRFYPIPETAQQNAIKVYVAAYPTQAATGIESSLMTRWRDAIVDGALAWLMSMPDQKWSNEKHSVIHLRAFEHKISRGRSEAAKSGTRGGRRVNYRPFA